MNKLPILLFPDDEQTDVDSRQLREKNLRFLLEDANFIPFSTLFGQSTHNRERIQTITITT